MNETPFDDLYISASQRQPPLNNLDVGSTAIDKVALPNPLESSSGYWSRSIIIFLPEWETVSDVAWMAFAWQTGVLEHHPGMPKETYAAMSATDLVQFYHVCTKGVHFYSLPRTWEIVP